MTFTCRSGCGACCIALSISTPFPGMPTGKRAGEPCPHLDPAYRCRIHDDPARPACCRGLAASAEMCGETREQALAHLEWLEAVTRPDDAPIGTPGGCVPGPRAGPQATGQTQG